MRDIASELVVATDSGGASTGVADDSSDVVDKPSTAVGTSEVLIVAGFVSPVHAARKKLAPINARNKEVGRGKNLLIDLINERFWC